MHSVTRPSRLESAGPAGEAGVSEVPRRSPTQVDRLPACATLEGAGLVEQIGTGASTGSGSGDPLAGAVTDRLDVVRQGHEVCKRLAVELGETINVAVLPEHFAVNVDQARGPSTVATHNWIGRLTPLHCTSSGKVLIAHLEPGRRTGLLQKSGMATLTPRTVIATERLDEELARVRETGYAVTVEEYELGLNAVAAPVHDRGPGDRGRVGVRPVLPARRRDPAAGRPLLAGTADHDAHGLHPPLTPPHPRSRTVVRPATSCSLCRTGDCARWCGAG